LTPPENRTPGFVLGCRATRSLPRFFYPSVTGIAFLTSAMCSAPWARELFGKVIKMREEYDFSEAKNSYAGMLKRQVTIRMDQIAIEL